MVGCPVSVRVAPVTECNMKFLNISSVFINYFVTFIKMALLFNSGCKTVFLVLNNIVAT